MKTRFQIWREKKEKSFDPLVIDQFDWDNEWADCCMFILKVRVDVRLLRMRMVLHGDLLMKLLVHQARCEAAIFKGKPATTSVQEMDLQGWLKKTQVQPMKKRKMTMIHMMMLM